MITTQIEQHTLHRTNQRNLRFKGIELASVDNRWVNGREQTRFTCLTVYRTTGSNYVLYREEISRWIGEDTHNEAEIYDSADTLIAALDESELSKELFEQLGPCFEHGLIEELD